MIDHFRTSQLNARISQRSLVAVKRHSHYMLTRLVSYRLFSSFPPCPLLLPPSLVLRLPSAACGGPTPRWRLSGAAAEQQQQGNGPSPPQPASRGLHAVDPSARHDGTILGVRAALGPRRCVRFVPGSLPPGAPSVPAHSARSALHRGPPHHRARTTPTMHAHAMPTQASGQHTQPHAGGHARRSGPRVRARGTVHRRFGFSQE